MKYKEVGFRAVYHRFCIVMLSEKLRRVIEGFPGAEEANAVLTYGYYDRDAGVTLEILAVAIVTDESFKFGIGKDEVTAKIRTGALEDEELLFYPDEDGKIAEFFSEKLDVLKSYDASEAVERTREMEFLDPCRHEQYIDDVLVRLVKEGLTPEECWVTITGIGDHYFIGTLLNEPNQDYGWHEGETIEFNVMKTDEGEMICYSDMDVYVKLTDEDLADGSMLKNAVTKFTEDRNEKNFLNVLRILRDSYVWVPCNAILSDNDAARFEEMIKEQGDDTDSMIGEEFTTMDELRMVPDILQSGDDFYFPIFSSEEEMGEYGEHFSIVQHHIFDVLPLARNNEKNVTGIVLNAFSEPFEIAKDLFEVVEGMRSRIKTPDNAEGEGE